MSNIPRLSLKLIVQGGVITGFCYAYCRLLLDKLDTLQEKDKIWVEGEESAKGQYQKPFTPAAIGLISHLKEQTRVDQFEEFSGLSATYRGYTEFKEAVVEFLSTFEKEENN